MVKVKVFISIGFGTFARRAKVNAEDFTTVSIYIASDQHKACVKAYIPQFKMQEMHSLSRCFAPNK